ncbi:hypothetical protein [Pseudonocardia alni]|uniref:VG15 protein n=1 Tax=Pseudonocardia alni TaxID=33907 RepID=UPI00331940A2
MTRPALALKLTRRELNTAVAKATQDLWDSIDLDNIDASWPAILDALIGIIAEAHGQGVEIAEDEYRTARLAAGILGDPPFAPATFRVDDLREALTINGPIALKVALRRRQSRERAIAVAMSRLVGTSTRLAADGARRTTLNMVAADGRSLGWARIPRPGACAFCMMLSTRGGAYKSRESALQTKDGLSYHAHCGCYPEPVFDDNWQPPKHVREAEKLYAETPTNGDAIKSFRAAYEAAQNT